MDELHPSSPSFGAAVEIALREPAIASLLANGAPVFVAAGTPPAIVYANESARLFFGAGADVATLEHRLFGAADQGSRRLVELAGLLRPDAPARLEKLRFAIGPRVEALTCLCRRVGAAGPLLIVAALGVRVDAPPAVAPPVAALAPVVIDRNAAGPANCNEAARSEPAAPRSLAEASADLATRYPLSPTVRFLWKSDAEGRLVELTGQLCEVVGCETRMLVGQDFAAQAGIAGADPEGLLAAALRRRDTWSGLGLKWPIAGAEACAPVVLGALPSYDTAREFDGFRGFGVIYARRLEARTAPVPVEEAAGPAPVVEAQTAAPPAGFAPANDSASAPVEPAGLETNVVALRSWQRTLPVVVKPPESEPAGIEPPVAPAAGPAGRPGADTGSRLVELTPAERRAFSDIALALGAKPISESERGEKARAGNEGALDETLTAAAATPVAALEADDEHDALDAIEPASNEAPAQVARRDVIALSPPPVEAGGVEDDAPAPPAASGAPLPLEAAVAQTAPVPPAAPEAEIAAGHEADLARNAATVLDRLPLGVLVSRLETPIYLNRALLELLGYASADAFHEAGGLDRLFQGSDPANFAADPTGASLSVQTASGAAVAVEGRMQKIDWDGAPATLMTFRKPAEPDHRQHVETLETELRQAEALNSELHAILDTATDGVATLDRNGRILSLNRSAEALFGYEQNEVAGEPFNVLLAPESHAVASEYFAGLRADGVASLLNDGREAIGRARKGGSIPVFMTLGRLGATGGKFCAVMRDMTHWKNAERELRDARREAERASQLKSDFLAKISHEIRTPLNAILGFAEVIMEERFGPVGNQRYKDYLKDIHASGGHVMSLVNDLLDLSKIEAGKLDLHFGAVDANRIFSECVALIQPQATVERVVVRSALSPRLPKIVADERSLRQIALNLLSNAVKFNEPGGQVIVSSALTESGNVVLRIKDTGVGMSESEVQMALEPFRQIQTSRSSGGTGLGLPLTKALVEANRASFVIRSKKNEGTLVEVAFPSTRVLAE